MREGVTCGRGMREGVTCGRGHTCGSWLCAIPGVTGVLLSSYAFVLPLTREFSNKTIICGRLADKRSAFHSTQSGNCTEHPYTHDIGGEGGDGPAATFVDS